MSVEIEIDFRGTATITLDESDYEKIALDYQGDYKSYIENMEIDRSLIDFDTEETNYSSSEVIDMLNLYKKKHNLTSNFQFPNEVLSVNFFLGCEISQSVYKNLIHQSTKLYIDKEALKKVVDSADAKNPNLTLNCVYFDEEYMVATNTRVLGIHKNTSNVNKTLIHKEFCKAYLKDAELHKYNDSILCKYQNQYYSWELKDRKFPDYERIIPASFKLEITKDEYFAKTVLMKDDMDKYIRLYPLSDETILIMNDSYLDEDFEKILINDHKKPAVIQSKDYKKVIMPIITDELDDFHKVEQ